MDNQKHPSCECEERQMVIRAGNDMLTAMTLLGRNHGLCALNVLVCAHLLVVYMKDVISNNPEVDRINTEAARKAEDIYHHSQAHVEKVYGMSTTLSSKRGKLC